MTLTQPQQRKVEQNIGLVGKVIKDKVHNPGQNSIYSYDDLYQIGCIGLCKAAYSDIWWAIPVMIIGTIVCAIIGGLIGKKLMKKHFEKAGVV